MAMSKKITTELLAAYAEGKVSKEEKVLVRQYLANNSAEMESVAVMMDDDYELTLDGVADDKVEDKSVLGRFVSSRISASANLCYSAAAFVAHDSVSDRDLKNMNDHPQRPCFSKCLDDLLDEM